MYVDMTNHNQRMNFFVGQEDDDMPGMYDLPGPEPQQLITPQIIPPEGLQTSQIMPPFTGPDGQLHELGLYHFTQPIDRARGNTSYPTASRLTTTPVD